MDAITDILGQELQRLAEIVNPLGVPVIIGGGYGLLLRQRHIENTGHQTIRAIPLARSTQDLDLFLTVEFVTDAEMMTTLRDGLQELGYKPIEGALFYQFARDVAMGSRTRSIKVDLLAPPPRDPDLQVQVKMKSRRIRPKETKNIHAHVTPEAFAVGEGLLHLPLDKEGNIQVGIPHPFSFLLLKLFAYRDRRYDEKKEFGRYHAFDLYRIVAMMTEEDFAQSEDFRDRYIDDPIVVDVRTIVDELFLDADSEGAIAILEHVATMGADLTRDDLAAFLDDLRTFFPPHED